MLGQGLAAAELHLTPAELGPMQVRVDSQQDRATVTFVSQHAATREAIEASLPRLRELFSSQGLELVDVDVSDDDSFQSPSEQQMSDKDSDQDSASAVQSGLRLSDSGEAVEGSHDVDRGLATTVTLHYGLVDAYA